jgi:manganese/zinc/iron transport system substrate-binding protein
MPIRFYLSSSALLAALLLPGCGDASNTLGGNGKPVVVCTTTMIADLAENIAGGHATVVNIMGVGKDPHVYEVLPQDAKAIKTADLVLYNGLHLEATLLNIIDDARTKKVALGESDEIQVLADAEVGEAVDPHCWMNVEYFKVYAQGVRDALIEVDPEHADAYRANADAYIKQLDELHAWVLEKVDQVPREQRVMITSHDAFRYLGDAYGIDVYAVIGISTEQAPRPQDVRALAETVEKNKVKALFIETSVSNTLNDMVRKVADQTGAKIGGTLHSDSLGEPESEAGTYIGMIRHNIDTIVDALK